MSLRGPLPNIKPTSRAASTKERSERPVMTDNGETPKEALDLSDVLCIQTKEGEELQFTVVGILQDADDGTSYAVLTPQTSDENDSEDETQAIVTDLHGNLIEDDELAQEILEDFLEIVEESQDENGGT
jgi:uncharacterized protein YrzB (UPF0473 family)